jgi:hypothetical protein
MTDRPPGKRTGPEVITPQARSNARVTATASDALIVARRPRGGTEPRCWRCGVAFADTDETVLRRCHQLAAAGVLAAGTAGPVHYADPEVAEGWAYDGTALPWLHHRAAAEPGLAAAGTAVR